LYLDPDLETTAMEHLKQPKDAALEEMLAVTKAAIPKQSYNGYYQAQRDKYAVLNRLFHHINADLVIVLNKNGEVIAFQCCAAVKILLSEAVQESIVEGLETYSTIHAVPAPDATRHGLHWIEWLKEHPEFDFRNPDNDLRKAKSGVLHGGCHCAVGHNAGSGGVSGTVDTAPSGAHVKDCPHLIQQQEILRYCVLGACTEVLKFFFRVLDPALLAEYEKVAAEVAKTDIRFQTRRDGSDFSVKNAILVNLMTTDHRDKSDWVRGFAALLPVGEYTGGDLLLRQLGLRIESPPGCVQFIRGHELSHSITKWNGRRFVIVSVIHEAVRKWALEQISLRGRHDREENSGEEDQEKKKPRVG
jgi:Oxygenase domain of the 2OGFeDO superfamily